MDKTRPSSDLSSNAFAALIESHQWALWAFLRGFVGDDSARDLTQDVFYDAWRAAQRSAAPFFVPLDEEGARRWLFKAAYRRAVSALRRRRLIRWESLDAADALRADGPLLALPFEDSVLEAQVLQATFAALPQESVACLLLSVVHEFTTAEIAEITGVSHEAAKKRLARAKQRLRADYLARNPRAEEHTPL
jgi:RNA polymerase sigma-70 factor (ECF subfamily)